MSAEPTGTLLDAFRNLPAAYNDISTVDIEQLSYEQFYNAYVAYATTMHAWDNRMMFVAPDTFIQPGDLQTIHNVVSTWPPKAPGKPARATEFIQFGLITEGNTAPTVALLLAAMVERLQRWCIANKVDPGNPNETTEERKARMNRERQNRHRKRSTADGSENADYIALEREKVRLHHSVRAGQAWLKAEKKRLRTVLDNQIVEARRAYEDAIKAGIDAVEAEQARLSDAELALFNYKAQ